MEDVAHRTDIAEMLDEFRAEMAAPGTGHRRRE
jgi:hypothetical protein